MNKLFYEIHDVAESQYGSIRILLADSLVCVCLASLAWAARLQDCKMMEGEKTYMFCQVSSSPAFDSRLYRSPPDMNSVTSKHLSSLTQTPRSRTTFSDFNFFMIATCRSHSEEFPMIRGQTMHGSPVPCTEWSELVYIFISSSAQNVGEGVHAATLPWALAHTILALFACMAVHVSCLTEELLLLRIQLSYIC